jgi:predicted nucleotide-binding protein
MARESRPLVFVGSSSEGLELSECIQEALDPVADVRLWKQGVFDLSSSFLESLIKALDDADFGILVLSADDITVSRGSESAAPRDNVLFELGLFMGRLWAGTLLLRFRPKPEPQNPD